jgi:hypothetical protein
MPAALSLDALLTKLGTRLEPAERAEARARFLPQAMPLGWPELDGALPDGGLPRGVVELACPAALGGATSVALAAVRAAQARDARAWAAWIEPEATLHGPGVARAGVDLARLLVVRPPRADVARIAVKVAASKAFDVVVVDWDSLPGTSGTGVSVSANAGAGAKKRAMPPEVVVRKLALHAEEGGATVILLTDSRARRAVQWPVALRVELARPNERDLDVRVTKDRRGRASPMKTISFASRQREAG